MKEEFTIQRSGKLFVLFAGLLDEAHAKGIKSIETVPKDVVFDDQGEPLYATFTARVVMKDDSVFTGFGDATRKNVGKNIVPHLIRMAETRAKARALRDAVNVGAASIEELGDESEDQQPPQQQPSRQPSNSASNGSANASQVARIKKLVEEVSYDGGLAGFEEKALKGNSVESITGPLATKIIKQLQSRKEELEAEDNEVDIDDVPGVARGVSREGSK